MSERRPDEAIELPTSDGRPPQLNMHLSASFTGMPLHMFPISGSVASNPSHIRAKRRQVKNACTNCRKACKKCDDARPCLRCVKYGVAEECMDSQRRERKRGIKRGPYKKRDGKGRSIGCSPTLLTNLIFIQDPGDTPEEESPRTAVAVAASATPAASAISPQATTLTPPPAGAYMTPVGFPPGFYTQYTPIPGRPGDIPTYFPSVYFAAPQVGDGEVLPYPMQPSYYASIIPYGQPFAPYVIQRPDGQVMASYPMYPKPPSAGGSNNQDNHPSNSTSDEEMTMDQEEDDDDDDKVVDD